MASDDDENQDDQRPDSDYDGAWKELLRSHLKEVIRECFPQLAAVIDWNIDPEWFPHGQRPRLSVAGSFGFSGGNISKLRSNFDRKAVIN